MIDPTRHLAVFRPDKHEMFGPKIIHIIGAGATGSRIAIGLAKLGIENLQVWDADKVEEHNVANQAYGNNDIGKYKFTALKERIKRETGTVISGGKMYIDASHMPLMQGAIFLLTDTMASRKELVEAMQGNLGIDIVIETRMGADELRIYIFNPNNPIEQSRWMGTLYTDEEAEVSVCGAQTAVGPTAELVSGMAVWQYIRWFDATQAYQPFEENELLFGIRPPGVITRSFAVQQKKKGKDVLWKRAV